MSEWLSVPLEELAADERSAISKPYGSAMVKDDYRLSGVPVVRGVNLTSGIFHDDDFVFIGPELVDKMPGAQLTSGDLVVTHRGTVGQVSMIPRSPKYERYVTSTSQVKVRLDPVRALPEFYYYWFTSTVGRRTILEHVSTVGVPGLVQPVATVKRLQVPYPPLRTQRAIADVLGAIDGKIAANTKLATTAGELAGLIYDLSAARSDARPMSDVLTPVLGGTPARSRADFWSGDQLWASAKDITGAPFGVLLSTDKKITEAAVAGTKAKPLPAGSVILTARGTVGAVARLAVPASFNQSCYGFVPGDIPPSVLYFAITRAVLRAREIAHGSVFDTITMKTFDHLPFPDFDTEALATTEGRIGPLLQVVAGVVRENSSLAATRDTLLPQLVSGKLRVKDAEKVLENAGV
jgi:type I restriction enzyme S subunit